MEANDSFDLTDIEPFIAEGERAADESLAGLDLRTLGGRGAVRLS